MSDHELFDHTDARSSSDSDNEDSEDDDEDDDDNESVNYFKDTDTADELEPDPVQNDEANRELTGPFETVEPDDLYAEQPMATEPANTYSTRSNNQARIHGPYDKVRRWVNTAHETLDFVSTP